MQICIYLCVKCSVVDINLHISPHFPTHKISLCVYIYIAITHQFKSIALVSITAQVVINCKVVVQFHQYSLFLLNQKSNKMKHTKIMLAVIATALTTWLTFGTISYLLNDISFKQTLISDAVLISCIIIGWLPSLIVWFDLTE